MKESVGLKDILLKKIEKNIDVVKHLEDVGPQLSREFVDYRGAYSPASRCEFCTHFNPTSMCVVVEGRIYAEGLCDAYSGGWNASSSYRVDNWEAFGRLLVEKQPLMLRIRHVVKSPCGWLVMMEDSMQNTPHRFSMAGYCFIEFTSRNNAWSMDDVAFPSSIEESVT